MTCDLLETMMSKQIDPDIYTINNFIGALCNSPKWQEAPLEPFKIHMARHFRSSARWIASDSPLRSRTRS